MWVITGPFDEEYGDVPPPDKSKLLKTGREYGIGRKDQPLLIKSKAISKAHAVFIVGECTEEQAADPSFIPTLTLQNLHDRSRHVERPTTSNPRMKCEGYSSLVLASEDVIHLSASVPVRVHWEPVCCYNGSHRAGPSISTKDCAALGIHLVHEHHPEVTHHLTPTYSLNPHIAVSLISLVTLVKPEWLVAILDAGKAEPGELSALEDKFALPPTSKYRPTFAPALSIRLKKFDAWQPNEERVGIFRDHLFIFVGEKGAEAPSALKELVKRGEGDYECFAVEDGPEHLRQVLAEGKARDTKLVLVADRPAVMAAVGEDGWRSLVEEARSFELKFLAPEKVMEAVVYVDTSYVDAAVGAEETTPESVLPDVVPNSIEDEPTFPPPRGVDVSTSERPKSVPEPAAPAEPSRKRLPRRATSRASSRAPSPPQASAVPGAALPREASQEPSQAELSQPRRTLVRRAARPKTIIGIDDTTMDIDGNSVSGRASEEPLTAVSSTRRTDSIIPPTPSRPSRLKRRVGTQAQSVTSDLFPPSADVMIPDVQEPPHKKYKALFDESDPDKVAQMDLEEYGSQHVSGGESMTQIEPSMLPPATQSGTQGRNGRIGGVRSEVSGGVPLEALMEEEEESTLATTRQTQTQTLAGTKRKSQAVDAEGDVEMSEDAPPRTRRRVEGGPETYPGESQAPRKPLSQIVTRVDMAQSQNHVKEKPAKKSGAPPGEPDKDAAFLKAVASTKRGKKSEDAFDREFNALRISKPDLAKEKAAEEWAVLDDFGDDSDLRGNFMVVLEMPVYKETTDRDHLRRGEGRLEWQGKPDFKKFRRKNPERRHQPVELVVDEEPDLAIETHTWKERSQSPSSLRPFSQRKIESETEQSATLRSTQKSSKSRRPTLVSDDDEEVATTSSKPASKPPSRSKSQGKRPQASKPPSVQASKGKSTRKTSHRQQPLFLDSDIEEEKEDGGGGLNLGSDLDLGSDFGEEDDSMLGTLRTSTGTQSTRTAKKRSALGMIDDDDSDDGSTFKAFGARTRSKRR
ncbi:hypothetical protein PYCCODRAFT_1414432 [Trametes coccinea BRFM310]|uniref:FHA domain-containing protein n=1 Tax=Trametes coccinea (strain BRFM310) TaxID=1353009 RepID=A0A1Y2IGW5_TRAC3|nr:hypothetical protein PYCCODRAFT_1414432 [Trametes coccinea BRFM310]